MHAQLRSVQLDIAQQRSAVRCRAVPCLVLPCAAVLCRAALCFLSNVEQCQVLHVLLCPIFLAFSSLDLSRSPCFFPHANYTRTADQNVTPPTSTQRSKGQFALHKQLLAISNRCSQQIMGLLFLPPLHVSVAFFLARA